MRDPVSQDGFTSGSPLTRAAERLGDPDLFPSEVTDLYARGKPQRARRALLRHARRFERNVDRAARQREAAADLRLWLDPGAAAPVLATLNGIGAGFIGRYQRQADGTHIATLWFQFLFIPLWPMAAYLVLPVARREWRVFGRVPLPPTARTARSSVGTLLVAGAIGLASSKTWQQWHTDLFVYNGFDRPAVVQVGDERRQVPPRHDAVFSNLPMKPARVEAGWVGSAEPFEVLEMDPRGHGGDRIIYNIAGRAVLGVHFVVYGPGRPREYQVLDAGPILFLERQAVHFLFQEPPDSITVKEGESVQRAVLDADDEVDDPVRAMDRLHSIGRTPQALALGRAELLAHPENAPVASYAATVLLRDDTAGRRALLRSCLDRAPDVVDLHRAYQDAIDWDTLGIRREYRVLLDRYPDSPMYRYLLGRTLNDTSAAAVAMFEAALALDTGYVPAWRALGYSAMMRGERVEALAYYDHLASLSAEAAREALEIQLRLRRRLERDPTEAERVLVAAMDRSPADASIVWLYAHARMERRPAAFDEEADAFVRRFADIVSSDLPDDVARGIRASLAVTAGRLDVARDLLSRLDARGDRHAGTALRLALSTGARPDDRALLTAIPNWFAELTPDLRLLALELLDPRERAAAVADAPHPLLTALGEALGDTEALIGGRTLDSVLGGELHGLSALAYFAAARRLAERAEPDALAARRRYLARARSVSLPGELPYLAR